MSLLSPVFLNKPVIRMEVFFLTSRLSVQESFLLGAAVGGPSPGITVTELGIVWVCAALVWLH